MDTQPEINESLRRDAERYRWLREQDWFSGPLAVVVRPKEAIKLGYDAPSRSRLDEAIDAAMTPSEPPQEETAEVVVEPGIGWRFLNEGEPLLPGDGYQHPDYPGIWIDYACRPDLFRGPKREYAHTWPWRRRLEPEG